MAKLFFTSFVMKKTGLKRRRMNIGNLQNNYNTTFGAQFLQNKKLTQLVKVTKPQKSSLKLCDSFAKIFPKTVLEVCDYNSYVDSYSDYFKIWLKNLSNNQTKLIDFISTYRDNAFDKFLGKLLDLAEKNDSFWVKETSIEEQILKKLIGK